MNITETSRVNIRPMTLKDISDLHAMNSDPEVTKYILGRPFSFDETEGFLNGYLKYYEKKDGLGVFAAEDKVTKEFIGWVCLRPFVDPKEIEIGYRLRKQSWGQGYATELTRQMIHYGFTTIGLQEIMAIVDPLNLNSKHVLTKSGLRYIQNRDYQFANDLMNVEYWKIQNLKSAP